MRVSVRILAFLFLLNGLVACSLSPDLATRPPVQVIRISYPPSLKPLVRQFQECSNNFPAAAIFLEESTASNLDIENHEILLWDGEPPDPALLAYFLGKGQILVVIHPDNPVKDLTESEIRNLLNGRFQDWSEAGENLGEVSVWIYPPENEIQRIFTQAFMRGEAYSPFAKIAPDPAAMIEAVSAVPGAVGLLPSLWADSSLNTLELKNPIRLTVLALTAHEPEGVARELLACVQAAEEIENTLESDKP
jgi:hypothetical protein